MTVRPAPKKTTKKSKTPLLDKARTLSPHAAGWDKVAAIQLAKEFADQTHPTMSLQAFLELAMSYKDVAGWANLVRASAVKHGLTHNSKFEE